MSSPSAEVSVVVTCHSLERWTSILAAVDSVLGQVEPPSAVIVAIDHNHQLADRVREARPGVRIAENGTAHHGASATRNCGAAACATPVIAFLDDDETAHDDWLERLVEPFGDPSVIGTGGRYEAQWQDGKPAWFPDELGWVVGSHHSAMPQSPQPVRNVWAGNMAVRASAFAAVGGFRVAFTTLGTRSRPDDTDLGIRMTAAHPGGVWIYLPDAVVRHEVPARRSTFSFFLRRCFAEGRDKIEIRNMLDGVDTLVEEKRYLRETIPQGVATHLRAGGSGPARAGAIIAGMAAAGLGASVATADAAVGRRAERPDLARRP